MSDYDFFPFIKPSNVGSIEFPNFDTIMKGEPVKLPENTGIPEKKSVDISDIDIDFSKLKISKGRQSKNTNGYKQVELTKIGKELKKRGYAIDFKSKDELIDSIALLE